MSTTPKLTGVLNGELDSYPGLHLVFPCGFEPATFQL
jgi:hypothetical protein